MSLHFVAHGHPAPKGSKRGVPIKRRNGEMGIAVIERPEVKTWESVVGNAAADAMARTDLTDFALRDGLVDGPLCCELTFSMQRPASHFRSGKYAQQLRVAAPVAPASKPDIDKLTRCVLDALIGVAITDDSRIVTLTVHKIYRTPIGVDVVLAPA